MQRAREKGTAMSGPQKESAGLDERVGLEWMDEGANCVSPGDVIGMLK